MVTEQRTKEYTEVEIDQIRADAAEEARRTAAEAIVTMLGDLPNWYDRDEIAAEIRKDFAL